MLLKVIWLFYGVGARPKSCIARNVMAALITYCRGDVMDNEELGHSPQRVFDEEELKERRRRQYKCSKLPVLREDCETHRDRELRLKLYAQVCSVWKQLVGVRFRLLGFVPGVSIVLLRTVLSKSEESLTQSGKLLICALGLAVTYGLFVYDWRNSELHDDLISRARKIEDDLGIDTGIFRGRLKGAGLYYHGVATGVIYTATMLAWFIAILGILDHLW